MKRPLFLCKYRLIRGAEPGADDHEGEGGEIGVGRHFLEDDQRKKGADKGGNGIIRAGPCRSEASLSINVEENAESVCHKSHGENGEYAPPIFGRDPLSEDESDDHRARARAESLDYDYLQGVFARKLPCAIVLYAPAETSQENEERSPRKAEACYVLKGENRAGKRYEADAEPKPRAYFLFKDHKGDQRGGDDLEIIEQRRVCRRGIGETEQQKYGRGDVKHHHCHGIGQVAPCQLFFA